MCLLKDRKNSGFFSLLHFDKYLFERNKMIKIVEIKMMMMIVYYEKGQKTN